jgi:hypothetical protein
MRPEKKLIPIPNCTFQCWPSHLVLLLLAVCLGGWPGYIIAQTVLDATNILGTPSLTPQKIHKLGVLEIFPMIKSYEPGYTQIERCFTGELLAKEPAASLNPVNLVFVPNDYRQIIEAAFTQAALDRDITPEQLPSLETAASNGVELVVAICPKIFAVPLKSDRSRVDIFYEVFNSHTKQVVFRNDIESNYKQGGMPTTLNGKNLVFMVGTHGANFEAERALLTFTMYRNAKELFSRLEAGVCNSP